MLTILIITVIAALVVGGVVGALTWTVCCWWVALLIALLAAFITASVTIAVCFMVKWLIMKKKAKEAVSGLMQTSCRLCKDDIKTITDLAITRQMMLGNFSAGLPDGFLDKVKAVNPDIEEDLTNGYKSEEVTE